ncbi:glycoside hydrolase family 3 protein [Eisenbergiella porci]|uniref:glycoside hydrolase family 3 protein n=1 Tax=Eisenbergiella TaxID=1432051 RepID=UPI001F1A103D
MIRTVSRHFTRTAVLLNVGNIIDMKWVETCKPSAVLYVWQGGMEGGSGVADVLAGRVNPCGRLSDTIARSIEDYPSSSCFGDQYRNFYTEDIYVGYRYFETTAKDKVLYPFGFGLSYTHFSMETLEFEEDSDSVSLKIAVANEGEFPGRQVVQVYVNPP